MCTCPCRADTFAILAVGGTTSGLAYNTNKWHPELDTGDS